MYAEQVNAVIELIARALEVVGVAAIGLAFATASASILVLVTKSAAASAEIGSSDVNPVAASH